MHRELLIKKIINSQISLTKPFFADHPQSLLFLKEKKWKGRFAWYRIDINETNRIHLEEVGVVQGKLSMVKGRGKSETKERKGEKRWRWH